MRNRLTEMGAGSLLESLLHLNPSSRCTMLDALQHNAFRPMHVSPPRQHPGPHCAAFVHYYRPTHQSNDLPLL